ncbi:MAG TPA: hypothetical protein VM599_02940, partial [Thermoanaerobaculia bacterium]|nr:hypothetical protein [Thermoanaerobaculia bacterium]
MSGIPVRPFHALLASLLLAPAAFGAASSQAAEAEHPVDPALFQGMEWRSVGPSRGGRVTAVAGVPGAPFTYYFGATGGGIWKTTDGGTTWKNVSDGFVESGSVGALAVAPSDPNVVYAGMGESPIRGVATGHGDGVYRSTDAGRTWTHLGLDGTEHVGGLAVHPRDPDVVWVAAQGSAWRPTAERGVYRSKDGGATWEQVLFVSEAAGASGLAMDPTNPRVLYAAFWDHDRDPWRIRSGGPGSGVWKTTDGGDTWERLGLGKDGGEEGRLPEVMGKVRVAVSPARPERVWAMVEADDGGLYRSDDAGETWRLVNGERVLRARAWYYTHVFADPVDADTVYVLNAPFMKSTDGGRTFSRVRTPHGDNHDLWIAPEDNRRMVNGNDGGANVSFNGGESWSTQSNQPTAQFYRVDVDSVFPYRLYGGQQDNSTVAIASAARGGIGRADWYDVGGCESAHVAFDPEDPARIYAGCYQGIITEWDAATRSERTIMAVPFLGLGTHPKDQPYRFNWNAPIEVSPHDPAVIYHAANVLLRSSDRGRTWTEVSPDLTRDEEDKQGAGGAPITDELAGGETYNTIFYLAPSPHEAGTIWVGTDDGLVHVTRDGGASWAEVSPPGFGTAAEPGQVNALEVSPHDPAAAYVAVTRYKFGDYRPYAFKTTDYGASWTAIGAGIPEGSWVRVVREDPVRRGLLYAGTETGAFVSFDDGARWQPLELGLPVVPVTDLKIQDDDLVAATQGRSFWILDELGPLRQAGGAVEEEVAAAGVHLYEPGRAVRVQWGGGWGGGGGDVVGKNPPGGAVIDYVLSAELAAELAGGQGGEGKGGLGSDRSRLGSDGHPEGSAGVASSPAGKRLRGTTPGSATQLRSSASGADVSGADGEGTVGGSATGVRSSASGADVSGAEGGGEAGGRTPQGEEGGDHQHLKRPTSASAGAGGGTEEEEKVAELRLEILDSEGRVV